MQVRWNHSKTKRTSIESSSPTILLVWLCLACTSAHEGFQIIMSFLSCQAPWRLWEYILSFCVFGFKKYVGWCVWALTWFAKIWMDQTVDDMLVHAFFCGISWYTKRIKKENDIGEAKLNYSEHSHPVGPIQSTASACNIDFAFWWAEPGAPALGRFGGGSRGGCGTCFIATCIRISNLHWARQKIAQDLNNKCPHNNVPSCFQPIP